MSLQSSPTATKFAAQRLETFGTEVGDDAALEPAPHAFDRIELRGIRGKAVNGEPAMAFPEVRRGVETAMGVQAVPEQHGVSPHVAVKMAKEADQVGGPHGLGLKREIGRRTTRAHPVTQRPNGGQPPPGAQAVRQDRRPAARRPRAANRGALGESALVEEDDRGPSASSVFFTRGQVS